MKDNSFSFSRLWLLFKLFLSTDKKRVILTSIVLYITFLVIYSSIYWMSNILRDEVEGMFINIAISIFAVVGVFFLLVSYQAAHSMPFMKNKIRQVAYIMVPASVKEKFTLSVLISFVIPILEMIAVLLLTELTMFIFTQEFLISSSIMDGGSALFELFTLGMNEDILSTVQETWLLRLGIFLIVSFIMSHAWFMCSASIFRKHPFLMGYIISYVVGQIFGLVFMFFGFGGILEIANYSAEQELMFLSNIWIVYSVASAILIVPLYYFAYRRMARAQL